ncbi:ornithine cyclodeaminase family protein [Roseivirga sp.]|uniref:ornithine cyclodeaminase family protein n=1 Tax=Roseivirga sp. TaxID=1964215 RepID=UPI003B8C0112
MMDISAKKTLVLAQDVVHDIVRSYGLNAIMDDLIGNLTEMIRSFDPKKTDIPIRSGFNYSSPNPGLVEWMPLYNKESDVVIKLVGYHPENPNKYDLPTILSTISAYDTHTGHLKCIVDGVLLTSLRTGAASAVASRLLASPQTEVLGLIGCGAQAVTQLHALSRVFKLKKVLIYDIDAEAMATFASRCEALEIDVEIEIVSIEEIAAESDIICTATSIETQEGPLFSDLPTKSYLHINAVGSDFPGKIEVPLDFLKKSFVCPDFREQAVIEGECQQLLPSDIGPELNHVLKNEKNYAHIRNERSVFDSTGWALEDAVVMELFASYARKLGLGKEMEIEAIEGDAKSPYGFIKKAAMAVKN